MLLTNAAFIFAMLLLFAACGWWAVAPFRAYIRFPLAVSVLAGMSLLSCTVLMIQVVAEWPFERAVWVGTIVLLAASATSIAVYGYKEVRRDGPQVLLLVLAVAVAVTYLVTRADIRNGDPSLVYLGGTDHLGYAHVADWLRIYGANTGLDIPPEVGMYSSFPDLALKTDPRFGTFSFVAFLSVISGRSGAFTYELACAVAMAAAAIGLAGLFARRHLLLGLGAAAILVCPMYEFSLLGHLGKINGYPAALLVAGLYFNLARADLDDDVQNFSMLASIAAVTGSAAMMFSGYVTALVLACFGGSYLLLQAAADWREGWGLLRLYARPAGVLTALVMLAILAYGVVARPLYIGFAVIDTPWRDLIYWATGANGRIPGVSELPAFLTTPTAVLIPLLALLVGALSIRAKCHECGAIILGLTVMVTLLVLSDDRWRFSQTIPLYLAAAICAACALIGSVRVRGSSWPVMPLSTAFLVICLAIGAYRAKPIADTLAGGPRTLQMYVFTESEIDGLVAKIKGTGPATVDVGPIPQLNLLLLLELGRAGAPVQFTETSWKAALGYRIWKYPGEKPGYVLRLVLRSDENTSKPALLYRTRQFDLL